MITPRPPQPAGSSASRAALQRATVALATAVRPARPRGAEFRLKADTTAMDDGRPPDPPSDRSAPAAPSRDGRDPDRRDRAPTPCKAQHTERAWRDRA